MEAKLHIFCDISKSAYRETRDSIPRWKMSFIHWVSEKFENVFDAEVVSYQSWAQLSEFSKTINQTDQIPEDSEIKAHQQGSYQKSEKFLSSALMWIQLFSI
jgi:hypothetical protein